MSQSLVATIYSKDRKSYQRGKSAVLLLKNQRERDQIMFRLRCHENFGQMEGRTNGRTDKFGEIEM